MCRKLLTVGASILLLSSLAMAAPDQGSMTNQGPDERFLKDAIAGGIAEVKMGELATKKATSSDVKEFGERLVDDHTAANQQLKSVAQKLDVSAPTEMTSEQKQMLSKLEGLSGSEFDREFMRHMVQDHRQDVMAFENISKTAKEEQLKTTASNLLPKLREHLSKAQSISQRLG